MSPAMPPIRVLVGEDQPLVREGIVRVLEESGFEVVGVAGDADELIRKAGGHRPDVVVTDIQMPPNNQDDGLRAAIMIRQRRPETGVIVLSQFLEDHYALDLVGDRAEGVGYLLKDRVASLDDLTDAVDRIAAGGTVLDPEVVAQLIGRRHDPLASLTPREREVLQLMAEGRSNAAIAQALFIGVGAVEKNVTAIFGKLGLEDSGSDHRRVLAVVAWLQR